MSGGRTSLNSSPIIFRSATQRFVTLSITEAETAAGVMVAQDMMYVYRVVTSLGLEVESPMILEMDHKGAVDLANSWSVGGRTRHIDARNHYLRDLKDQGLLLVRHVPEDENETDIFTKNTATQMFEKHIKKFVGEDEYMKVEAPTADCRGFLVLVKSYAEARIFDSDTCWPMIRMLLPHLPSISSADVSRLEAQSPT